MRERSGKWGIFFLVVIICLGLILLSQLSFFSPIRGGLEKVLITIQKSITGADKPDSSEIEKVKLENQKLQTKLAKDYLLEKENQAFRDQFALSQDIAKSLLPAVVLSHRDNDTMLLDKGSSDGVLIGKAVIVNDNLVGIITNVTPHTSRVLLTIAKDFSTASQTVKTNALGVSRGQEDDGILFQNVLLSDTLEPSDFVTTKGSEDEKQPGLPPGLIIGKIASIDKKSSALYQSAKVTSLLNFSKLRLVFITLQ